MQHGWFTQPDWLRPRWILAGLILLAALLRLWQLDVLPPGLYFDEAFNGLDASRVVSGEYRPLFFEANNGREPLYIYLQSLAVWLLGPKAYSLRLVSALIGTATVAVIYWATCVMLEPTAGEEPNGPGGANATSWLALIAAAGIAVSYWHLSLSRLAFRAVLLIPISTLAVANFWRAWTGQRLRVYAWSGLWFALALYTYTAARLLPLVVLSFVLIEFIGEGRRNRQELWQRWRPRLQGLGVLALVGLLGTVPLALAIWSSPALLSARTADVSILTVTQQHVPGTPLQRLLGNMVLVARSFYDQGDLNLRHNLPGRPVNDPLLALLFTLGLLTALWRIRRARYRLLLLWLGVMVLPTLLSIEAPHSLRMAGALPVVAMFYAIGGGSIYEAWRRFGRGPLRASLAVPLILLAGIVLISGSWTMRDYFLRWAQSPKLGQAFDLEVQLAATEATRLLEDPQGDPVLLSYRLFAQPHMAFALGEVMPEEAIPVASPSSGASTLLLESNFDSAGAMFEVWRESEGLRSAWLEPFGSQMETQATDSPEQVTPAAWLRSPIHQAGWPEIAVLVLPSELTMTPRRVRYPLGVNFANGLRLVGYDIGPDTVESGDPAASVRLSLFWQADPAQLDQGLRPGTDGSEVFAHLAERDAVWATKNGPIGNGYGVYRLLEGATVEDVRLLPVPQAMPAGKAYVETGLYHYDPGTGPDGQDRIKVLDGQGQPVADQVTLGAVMVGDLPQQAELGDLTSLGARFEDRIELVGWHAAEDSGDGSRLLVDLGWRALERPNTDYTAFVHLLDAAGQIASQYDQPPGSLDNPTSRWVPGESVRATFPLTLPVNFDPGAFRLRIGLYEPVSGRQMSLSDAAVTGVGAPGDSFVVIPLEGQ